MSDDSRPRAISVSGRKMDETNKAKIRSTITKTMEELHQSEVWYTASGRKMPRRGKNVLNWWRCSPQEREELIKTTIAEWTTLTDEKRAIVVIPPQEAQHIREQFPDRIMESKLVHTGTQQADHSLKYKSRWCVMGNGDPDRLLEVEDGRLLQVAQAG